MARSGEVILDSLFNNAILEELVPSRIPKTRIGILFAVLAAEIEGWEIVLDNFRDESFVSTARLTQNIVKLSEPYYSMIIARASDVVIRFTWEEGYTPVDDVIIPFGQIIETDEIDPIQYQTIERTILYKNSSVAVVRARSIEKGSYTMVNPGEIKIINVPPGAGIEVTNPETSWGGRDDETISAVKNHSLAARYSMTKSTEDYIKIRLGELGLDPYQYNIVDNAYDFGSFGVYVDTEVEEQITELAMAIKEAKAHGIYFICEMAVQIPLDLRFNVKVVNEHDLTPEERDNLKKDLRAEVENFIILNGVGNKIVTSRLTHHIYQILLEKYNLFEVTITNELLDSNLLDDNNNILINPEQVAKIASLLVTISTA